MGAIARTRYYLRHLDKLHIFPLYFHILRQQHNKVLIGPTREREDSGPKEEECSSLHYSADSRRSRIDMDCSNSVQLSNALAKGECAGFHLSPPTSTSHLAPPAFVCRSVRLSGPWTPPRKANNGRCGDMAVPPTGSSHAHCWPTTGPLAPSILLHSGLIT